MKFRLVKTSEQNDYSNALLHFESQFDYPLGDKTFQIKHGHKTGRYNDFFTDLGQSYRFVLEHKGILLGTGCAVLRQNNALERQRFWYLCDFKLCKSMRGKNKLWPLLLKYFLLFYCQSKQLVVINMSAPVNNPLVKKIKSYLFFLTLKTHSMAFYEWSYDEYIKVKKALPNGFNEMGLYTNWGKKDIVIAGDLQPILHLVDQVHADKNLPHHSCVNENSSLLSKMQSQTPCKPLIMLATLDPTLIALLEQHQVMPSYKGTMLASKTVDVQQLKFSSLEI